MGVSRQHMDNLYPVSAYLKLNNLSGSHLPFLDQAMTNHNYEEFTIAIVPMLAFRESGL